MRFRTFEVAPPVGSVRVRGVVDDGNSADDGESRDATAWTVRLFADEGRRDRRTVPGPPSRPGASSPSTGPSGA